MAQNSGFLLDVSAGYFRNAGVDVMAFDDIYPAGHQSGVSILMHGNRVATNGDIRFEQTPGQWQPLPKQGERKLSEAENSITTRLHYPDMDNHLKNFNPMMAMAADFVIAEVEEIVEVGQIDPDQVCTPGACVDMVVQL